MHNPGDKHPTRSGIEPGRPASEFRDTTGLNVTVTRCHPLGLVLQQVFFTVNLSSRTRQKLTTWCFIQI